MIPVALLSMLGAPIDQEVSFIGAGGQRLAGTLTRSSRPGAHPAVLLLPGSGPTDRNGNSPLVPTRIDLLKQIADRLAAEGIDSLRFDKRATARYRADWPKNLAALGDYFAWENFSGDATAAYRFLRSQRGVDSKRVGILGHSEGALITLQIAADLAGRAEAPATFVLVSGNGRKMGVVIHDQIAGQLQRAGMPVAGNEILNYADRACAALAAGRPLPPNMPPALGGLFNPSALKLVGAYCRIDPAALAAKTKGDALIVNGEEDTQVSAKKDAPVLDRTLRARRSGKVELTIVPGASHNLKSTDSGNRDAFEGPVVPRALATIVAFLKRELRP